ncbi:hypothetical protein NDU88_002787 [Pleurodeles waltl]|uniref:Uncharacterized protein n=1 Tax=Pleurodeles waltl TaxID=8319 RepID=A0AAV7MC21_PLEWA|nr:hypothetical protein NDU88_002787 [Pleurodeles waltl]
MTTLRWGRERSAVQDEKQTRSEVVKKTKSGTLKTSGSRQSAGTPPETLQLPPWFKRARATKVLMARIKPLSLTPENALQTHRQRRPSSPTRNTPPKMLIKHNQKHTSKDAHQAQPETNAKDAHKAQPETHHQRCPPSTTGNTRQRPSLGTTRNTPPKTPVKHNQKHTPKTPIKHNQKHTAKDDHQAQPEIHAKDPHQAQPETHRQRRPSSTTRTQTI